MHWGPVTPGAAHEVGRAMRESDRRECMALYGWGPHEAVSRSLQNSTVQRAIYGDDGEPLGVCGVTAGGIVWLLATDGLLSTRRRRAQFHREAQCWIEGLASSRLFPVLENWTCWAPGRARWLRSLGLTSSGILSSPANLLILHVTRRISEW